jgi:hypothetical protein
MTSILFNLSGKIEKPVVDTLHILKKAADSLGIPFFVVGAFSRDLILKHGYGIEPRILDAETEELSQYKLLTNMIRETGMAETRFDEILAQLMKLRQGFGEVGEKP